jgi:hypothetical protein
MTARRVVSWLLGAAVAELLLVIVTGGGTPLPGGSVSLRGFVVRCCVIAALLVARGRVLASPARRLSRARLLLLLLLLPTLAQFQFAGGRVNGDGLMYYVYVHSFAKDGDVDLTDEYAHYGLLTRGDLAMPTKTGLRRSIFAVGPPVVWLPFFALGEAVGRVQGLFGPVDLDGYGPVHRNAVALGSLLYGFAAVWLMHDLLRRHFGEPAAIGAALLAWGATFLPWYMVQQPTMSHAPSAFGAALALWLWDVQRDARSTRGFLLLGAVMGLAMCLRWQNGVLLVLPGLDLLQRAWRTRRIAPLVLPGALLALGAIVGVSPQLFAWKAIYGAYLLPCPPHGCDFVRLDHPFLLQTFFSSRHGLFSWTPVFWLGYLGFVPLALRRPRLAATLAVPLVLMTYVNVCSGDWWAGGSFSNRRFDSLLPVLAFGFAASIDTARAALRARPELALAVFSAPFALWGAVLHEQARRGQTSLDAPVAFPLLVRRGAAIFADAVGSPSTWPASWLFATREHRPPGQYDLLVGRYLFYRQNSMGGHVGIGTAEDDVMLAEGWGPRETFLDEPARRATCPRTCGCACARRRFGPRRCGCASTART